jgi:hypothetical protein
VLIVIFERLENFFKRFELYIKVPPPAAMTDVIEKIMTEVLSVVTVASKEIGQSRWSESIDIHKLLLTYVLQEKF